MRRFEGKVAVVAGGATGIGAETARRLASEGAQVVVGDIHLAGAEAVAAGIADTGETAIGTWFDFVDDDSVAAMMRTAMTTYGGIDCLFNVGADFREETTAADSNVVDIDLDHFDYLLRVDLRGYLSTCRHAIPHMLVRGGGSILNMTSDTAFMLSPGGSNGVGYSAAKLGIVAISRRIVARWGKEGIRCNCVSGGAITTDTLLRGLRQLFGPKFGPDDLAASNPSGRLCTPADVAATVAFLLADESIGINGQIIHVNGGSTVTM